MQEVYGQLYTQENVAISGIHTHSGPAGYLQYLLYDIPARGFVHETFNVLVNGIVMVSLRHSSKLQSVHFIQHSWCPQSELSSTLGNVPICTQALVGTHRIAVGHCCS